MRGPRPSSRLNNKRGRMLNMIVVIAVIILALFIISVVFSFIKTKVSESKGITLTLNDVIEISNTPSNLTIDLIMNKNVSRNIKTLDEHSTMIKLNTEMEGVLVTAMSVDPTTGELIGLMLTRPDDKEALNLTPDNSKYIKDFVEGKFTEGLNK